MVTILTVERNKKKNYLSVTFAYCPHYVRRIKDIPSAEFNEKKKAWLIDVEELYLLEDIFKGELYFKTPKWKILGELPPEPNLKLSKTYPLPKLKAGVAPYPYQEFGYQFLMNRLHEYGFCMLCDSVGLGKTPQTIMTMSKLIEEGTVRKALVLCKKSLKRQWEREIAKFSILHDTLSYIAYVPENADKKKRLKMFEELKKSNSGIFITTYESCMNDKKLLSGMDFDLVIIDEVHLIKAPGKSKNSAVKETIDKIKYKILLTGTPITNKPIDLYGIVGLCDPKYFDMKITAFKKRYVTYYHNGKFVQEVGYKNIDELREKCQNIMLRRTEAEVDLSLPKVRYKVIKCEADAMQGKLLRLIMAMYREVSDKLDDIEEEDLKKDPLLKDKLEAKKKGILGFRQVVANDPSIFKYGKSPMVRAILDDNKEFYKYKMSNKTDRLLDLLYEIIEKGEKAIVFSKHERTVRYLYDRIYEELDAEAVCYSGKMLEEDRNESIDLFCSNDNVQVFLATNSASEGLNIQISNHVINYDLPDTVAIGMQRMGRARRAGSKYKEVFVYNMITIGTVDEKNKEKLDKQKKLFNSVVELDEEESKLIRKLSN